MKKTNLKKGLWYILLVLLSIGTGYGLAVGLNLPYNLERGSVQQTSIKKKDITTPLISLEEAFIKAVEEIKPSVVNLSVERSIKGEGPGEIWRRFRHESPFDEFFERFFDDIPGWRTYRQRSLGTGFIVDEEGYILTNRHVIAGADTIKVSLLDGRRFTGKVVASDPKTDLALIKIDVKDKLPVVKFGDSDKVKIGSWAIAIGNPFGLEHTVTVGVISAKGRVVGVAEYEDFFQTDASINPGNSGGPLVNIHGEVIGVNTAIVAGGQGIGFAIPINMARKVIEDLRIHGEVRRPWLGVYIQDITPELAKQFGVKEREGVLVADVLKGSPAHEAGIKRGDIIKRIDDVEVTSAAELQREVLKKKIGTRITLLIRRDNREWELSLRLAKLPKRLTEPVEREEEWLGLVVEELTRELARKFSHSPDEEGVIITEIKPGSPGERAGLKKGDLIKEINRKEVHSISDFERIVAEVSKEKGVVLLIKRKGHTFYVSIEEE